jgi:prevent-host-death family protein
MHVRTSSRKLRENWRAFLDHVTATDDRLVVTRHGQPVAALVSLGDLQVLEAAEEGRGDG